MRTRKLGCIFMGFALLMFCLSGCYYKWNTPMIHTSMNFNGTGQSKVGKATCKQFIWFFGDGDCSLTTAMKNGNISKVHHVDTDVNVLLWGIYSEYTMVVYGD